jgi:ABC-type glycerol-3-phosphate transport system substrate-binding protein
MMMERIMIGRFRLAALHAARSSIAVGIAVAALSCSAPVGAETSDQLYALAKVEKTLVMWAAGPTAGCESAARAFEQQFPGVTVSLMGGLSNLLNAKIEEQIRTRKVETDLVILQSIQDFVAWNASGLLLHFKPEGFDKIGAGSKDRDGAWVAVTTNPIFYGYNTENVRSEDVPKSATDFLQPQFRGQTHQHLSDI